jgi:hypothetical protein
MPLRQLVGQLADLIWQREQGMQRAVEDAILTYVHDAVTTELEYRRRMHELEHRLGEIERIPEPSTAG